MDWFHALIDFLKRMYEEYEWFFGLFGVSLAGIAYGLYKFAVWLFLPIIKRKRMKTSEKKNLPKRKNPPRKRIP